MPDTAPVTPEALAAELVRFVADAKAKASGGITVAEFGQLVVELLRIAVTGLEAVPVDGPAKKAWALGVVGLLFDSVAGYAVPIWLQPVWLLARPAVRAIVLAAAGGALEQILAMTRATSPAVEVR